MELKGILRVVIAQAIVVLPLAAAGSDYQDAEELAPTSAQEASVGLQGVETERILAPTRAVLEDLLANAPPFWRDTKSSLRIRTFDFRRDNDEITIGDATAAGFELAVDSGKWRDSLSLSLSWSTSYGVDAPEGLGQTGVLGPDQSDISVLSRAFAQWDFSDASHVRLYRQEFNMPYINRQDSRMIPSTYEAYVFQHSGERLQGVLGHVTKMKRRDSDEFVSMGEVAGVPGNDNGTSVVGLQYEWESGLMIGALAQHTRDLFTTTYSETSYNYEFSEDWGTQLAAQLTNQWSVGTQLLGDFNTYAWGLRGKLSYRGAVLTLASTSIGSDGIRRPFGGSPGYTSSMIANFDRARERGTRFGLSQNFETYGLPGVSVTLNYTKGSDAVSALGVRLDDEDEFNVTADYRPEKGLLKGLWFRIRYGELDRGAPTANRRDLRIIVNYRLSAFQ